MFLLPVKLRHYHYRLNTRHPPSERLGVPAISAQNKITTPWTTSIDSLARFSPFPRVVPDTFYKALNLGPFLLLSYSPLASTGSPLSQNQDILTREILFLWNSSLSEYALRNVWILHYWKLLSKVSWLHVFLTVPFSWKISQLYIIRILLFHIYKHVVVLHIHPRSCRQNNI